MIMIMVPATTIIHMPEPAPPGQDFLRLLSWVSPAFPTGGYAYSHGLEWAVEQGDVRDVETLCAWISALLRHGSIGNDLIILHAAWMAGQDDGQLREITRFACACATSRERYEETVYQGEAFLRAAGGGGGVPPKAALAGVRWALPVAQGLVFRRGGVACGQAVLSGGYAAVAALVSAAARLVPLGRTDGLHALARLAPVLAEVARHTREQTRDDVGGACFGSDLAAMYHETQETRLFRT